MRGQAGRATASERTGRNSWAGRTGRTGRVAASLAVIAALVTGLAACSNDPLAEQYRAGDGKGYIAADGTRFVEIPIDERGEPIQFDGTDEQGEAVSDADFAGKPLVVNFWYANCAPCRAEAGALEEAYQAVAADGVSFLGINTQDSADAAIAFATTYDVTYPSLITIEDSAVKLAFAAHTSLAATPSTLVLDGEGRLAARIIGPISDAYVLEQMIKTVLEETS